MKTIAALAMALGTLVLATAADAGCYSRGQITAVRAGTPCVFMGFHHAEIIKPPQNGTAVLRADGSIYYSPKPGFTGQDPMKVRFSRLIGSPTSPHAQFETATETYVIWVY
jgi:hypothetical protein